MQRLSRLLRSFTANDGGTTAIEYGLICSLIVLVILSGVTAVADGTVALFELLTASTF